MKILLKNYYTELDYIENKKSCILGYTFNNGILDNEFKIKVNHNNFVKVELDEETLTNFCYIKISYEKNPKKTLNNLQKNWLKENLNMLTNKFDSNFYFKKLRFRLIDFCKEYPIKVRLYINSCKIRNESFVLMLKTKKELIELLNLFNSVSEIDIKKLFCTYKFEQSALLLRMENDLYG